MTEEIAKRDRAIVNCIGKVLLQRNHCLVEERIPDRLVTLLRLLERKERDETATADDPINE